MSNEFKRTSILVQVAIFFAIGVAVTGILGYFSQQVISHNSVLSSTESLSSRVAEEVMYAIHQYPASDWLLDYWYENSDELDIEYDAPIDKRSETAKKAEKLQKKYPDLLLSYATEEDVKALPPKDQKIYAEVVYSWLINHVDQIKKAYKMNFLYVCLTDKDYKEQFFLISAADPGAKRGTDYNEVYTMGVVTPMEGNQSLQDGMRDAFENSDHLSAAGAYMDYYAYIEEVKDMHALVGLTFSVEKMETEAATKALHGTFFAVLFQILLALICLTLIYVFLLMPLKKVQETIRLYAETKDSELVTGNLAAINSKNEIMELSADITGLAEEIDNYMEEIETISRERERIGAELNIASQIQVNMMPQAKNAIEDYKTFDIYASMDPAKEVGGDFYDFFMIDDDHLCLVIADVSGKGVPAALFMVVAKTLIKNRAQMGETPSDILAGVNEQLKEGNKNSMFVTVWIGILDLTTGKGMAANAGHEHPAVCSPNGNFELVKYRHSPVVGAMEGIPYREHEFQMEPGGTLFVYTDGLPEATNSGDELFGEERLLQTLNENPNVPLDELLQSTKERIMEFTGDAEQFDDMTMLAIRWYGKEKPEEKPEDK